MFSYCYHWEVICLGKFWFPFHGIKALWHFHHESTVSLYSGTRFIGSALRQTTQNLTFRIYHPFSGSNKLENASELWMWKFPFILCGEPFSQNNLHDSLLLRQKKRLTCNAKGDAAWNVCVIKWTVRLYLKLKLLQLQLMNISIINHSTYYFLH